MPSCDTSTSVRWPVCSGWSAEMSPLLLQWCCGAMVWCTVGAGASLHSLCTSRRPGRCHTVTYTQSVGPQPHCTQHGAHSSTGSSDTWARVTSDTSHDTRDTWPGVGWREVAPAAGDTQLVRAAGQSRSGWLTRSHGTWTLQPPLTGASYC